VEVKVGSYKGGKLQRHQQQQHSVPSPTTQQQTKVLIALPPKERCVIAHTPKATSSPKPTRLHLVQVVGQLQQLADAKAETADMQCSFNFFDEEEREVWTCGQNSYGELGHADTTTRKVPTRVCCLQVDFVFVFFFVF
jgi:hypothetical protein